MKEAVIVSGARTPVGKAKKGSLATVRPDDLGAICVKETLKRAGGYEGNIDDTQIAPKSSGRTVANDPFFAFPTGVLAPDTMTASFISSLLIP